MKAEAHHALSAFFAALQQPAVAPLWTTDSGRRPLPHGIFTTPLGQHWAGYVEVRDAYDWDPATLVKGIGEEAIIGVEAPLWTETLRTTAEVEYMAFPRLLGIAEIGWSPVAGRVWDEYRLRLAAHGSRLQALGVNFYRWPQVDWR